MKNSILLYLFSLTLFIACSKDDAETPLCTDCTFTCIDANEVNVIGNNCIDNWNCTFKVLPQSKVSLDSFYGVTTGDKQVFQMIQSTEGKEEIADDEFLHVLVFELDEAQTSFSIEGADLEAIQTHFRQYCYCGEVDFIPINAGCLQGTQQTDSTWLVQGNLSVPYSFDELEVKFDALFSK